MAHRRRRASFLLRAKHYLIPHAGNKYKPRIFLRDSVALIIALLLLGEGVYLLDAKLALKNLGFVATVLPSALLELANADRNTQGLPTLVEDPQLDIAAQNKANDMAAKGYFSHVSPDGKTPWYWLDQIQYPYTYAGENLAIDFNEAKDVETAWMNSPTHRANILKPQYSKVGYGVAQGTYQGQATTFVVQVFASTEASAAAANVETQPTHVSESPKTLAPRVLAANTPTPQTVHTEQTVAATDQKPVVQQPPPAPTPSPATARAVPSRLNSLLASPRHALLAVLAAFLAFISLLYLISLALHVRNKYLHTELVVGGAVLVGLGFALIIFNANTLTGATLPQDSQAASVVVAASF